MTLGEATRLDVALMQFRYAEARVRELEPNWRATPQLTETVEGQVRAYEAMTLEANARYFELRSQGILPFSQTPPPISPPEPTPKVPAELPATARQANLTVVSVARWLGAMTSILGLFEIAEPGSWIYEQVARIDAYLDPPKTLEELQRAVDERAFGYDIHHIVEQGPALRDGFPRARVDGRGNLVRIPTFKHWEINRWFEKANADYGWLTPRQYVRGKDWDRRFEVGLDALVEAGVLLP